MKFPNNSAIDKTTKQCSLALVGRNRQFSNLDKVSLLCPFLDLLQIIRLSVFSAMTDREN